MSPNDEKAFVRAKPTKIIIEEQYHYRANVQENLVLSFEKDKSRGEIKVEFVYDGKPLPPGWKTAILLQGLRGKWKLPDQIRKCIAAWHKDRFVGPVVRGVGWLFERVWCIIWRLPEHLIKQYFPDLRPDASKSFDASALADVEKYGAGFGEARVGYLALRGYRKPTFDEDWPEHCTIPLEIPIDDFGSKIRDSRKYVIKRPYPLKEKEPKKRLVRLGNVSLCDEVPDDKRSDLDIQRMEDARVTRTDMGEMLWLEIPLIVDIEPPDLDEKNRLKPDVARDLWKREKKRKEGQKKQATTQENEAGREEDPPFADQLAFFTEEERDESDIKEALSRLSRRGGYLFFAIDSEEDKKALEELQEKVLEIALVKCSPPVPIMKPYVIGDGDKQQLAIVPVPQHLIHSRSRRRGTRKGIEISWWELDLEPGRLARALEAAANTDGGCVIVEIGPIDDPDKILAISQSTREKIVKQVGSCTPPMTSLYISPPRLVNEKAVLIVIPPELPYVFTHRDDKGKCKAAWIREGRIEEMGINDIYELFKERGELHYPTLVEPPVVTYACVEWPYMDYRKRQGIRHDPDNRALEWVDVDKETMQQTSHDVFETTIAVQIMHPIELYQEGHVKGQIRVQFDRQLWSGLDVEYFDATGQRHPGRNEPGPETVKSTTVVVIHLDIPLNAIIKRRPFHSYRRLEFEGVEPDPDRLADIKSLLTDLGLEDIEVQTAFDLSHYLSDRAIFEEVVSRWGVLITGHSHERNLQVKLKMIGSPQTISRQRKNGKRIDRMQVPTGQLRITLAGRAKGESSPLELSVLLNQIQHLLKERFSVMRMHLK